MRLVTFIVLLTTAMACAKKPAPGTDGRASPLVLEAAVDRAEIAGTDTTTATFRLRNQSRDTVRLSFSSGCQIVPNIVEHGSGNPVALGTMCSMALTELVLAPGTESTTSLLIGGREAVGVDDHARLAPGEYRVFATATSSSATLRSEDVRLTVR